MHRTRLGSLLAVAALAAAIVAPSAASAATTIKLSGSTTVLPLAQQWAVAYHKAKPLVNVIVTGGGSGVGFSNVNAGTVDIGMSSRDPKPGWETDAITTTVIAKDALCLAVNPGNSVRKLTKAQIKGIFTGAITNWNQVGGANARIILCGRTGASGTYEYFKEAFLDKARQSSATKQYASNGMVRSAVSRSKYAIGYLSLAYVNSSVRSVSVDGVAATRTNAANGRYKYVRPLYFLTKGAQPSAVNSFIAWCKGSAGQAIAIKEYLHR